MKNRGFATILSCLMLIFGVILIVTLVINGDKTIAAPPFDTTWDSQVPDHDWYQIFNNDDIDDPRFGGITYSNTDVFRVFTARDLASVSYMSNHDGRTFEGKTVRLMNDINLAGFYWVPIGSNAVGTTFRGTFDGSGFQITNFAPIATDNRIGFIGQAAGEILIKNLTLNGNITVEAADAGEHVLVAPFVADMWSGSSHRLKIDNCQNYVEFDTSRVTQDVKMTIAGITSVDLDLINGTSVEITRCINFSDIPGAGVEGGVAAGIAVSAVNVSDCANYGKISSTVVGGISDVAGIVGKFGKGTVRNSYNMGNISVADGRAGGIVSLLRNQTVVEVYNCMNVGNITAGSLGDESTFLGGIVASVSYSSTNFGVSVFNNANYGVLSAARNASWVRIGGIIGDIRGLGGSDIARLENLISEAVVNKGSQTVGAIVGAVRQSSGLVILNHCFTKEGESSYRTTHITYVGASIENCGFVTEDGTVDMLSGFDIDPYKNAQVLLDENTLQIKQLYSKDFLRWNSWDWTAETWPFSYSSYRTHKYNFTNKTWTPTSWNSFDGFNRMVPNTDLPGEWLFPGHTLPNPAKKSGWAFYGYSLTPGSGEVIYRANRPSSIFRNIELYEVWGAEANTITYVLDPQNSKVGISFPESALTEFTGMEVGYTFPFPVYLSPGWQFSHWVKVTTVIDDKTHKETKVRERVTSITADMVGKDIVLEAINELTTYKILYHLEYGETSTETESFDLGLVWKTAEARIKSLMFPEREGYVFKGWYRDSSLGEHLSSGTIDVIHEANYLDAEGETILNLWARWEPRQYTITFHMNNGSNAEYKEIFVYDAPKTVSMEMAPIRDGYTFAGWSHVQDWKLGTHGESGLDFPVSETRNLSATKNDDYYAAWFPNEYNVRFFMRWPNATEYEDYLLDYESEIPFPSTEREHYRFVDWLIVLQVGTGYTVTTTSFNQKLVPLNGIMLAARWEALLYTVSYETDGGASITPIQIPHGMGLVTPNTAKTDCYIEGWYTDAGRTIKFNFNLDVMPTHDLVLYVKWAVDLTPLRTFYNSYLARVAEEYFEEDFGKSPELDPFRAALAAAKVILESQETPDLNTVTAVREQLINAASNLGIAYPNGELIPSTGARPNDFSDILRYAAIGLGVAVVLLLSFVRKPEPKKAAVAPAPVSFKPALPSKAVPPARPMPTAAPRSAPPPPPLYTSAMSRPTAPAPSSVASPHMAPSRPAPAAPASGYPTPMTRPASPVPPSFSAPIPIPPSRPAPVAPIASPAPAHPTAETTTVASSVPPSSTAPIGTVSSSRPAPAPTVSALVPVHPTAAPTSVLATPPVTASTAPVSVSPTPPVPPTTLPTPPPTAPSAPLAPPPPTFPTPPSEAPTAPIAPLPTPPTHSPSAPPPGPMPPTTPTLPPSIPAPPPPVSSEPPATI